MTITTTDNILHRLGIERGTDFTYSGPDIALMTEALKFYAYTNTRLSSGRASRACEIADTLDLGFETVTRAVGA